MNIPEYIIELILTHNRITIAGLGIVSSKYKSAIIHPSSYIFQPPSKQLSFIRDISSDDFSLANLIAEKEKKTFKDAQGAVRSFVSSLEYDLSTNGKAEITGVGKLFYDIERNLHFDIDATANFLLSSYGLEHFVARPVMRKEIVQQYDKRLVDTKKKKRLIWFRF